jgi:PAS domain S-box-containing protein
MLPWVVLTCTLLSTFAVAYYVWSKDKLRTDSAASKAVQSARDRLQNRMDSYVALLRGAAGLMSNRLSEGAERIPTHADEFASYVERLELQENYPGIQGVGFALRLMPDERAGFEDAMRKSGAKDFKISTPEAKSAEAFPIVFLEPKDARNSTAIGFDMFAEPTRHAAMVIARDTAKPAASGPVRLKQEAEEKSPQNGFLIYLPVYHTVVPPTDPAARRVELAGFVYAPFRAGDLLNGIFPPGNVPVDFSVYDGATLLDRTDGPEDPGQGPPPDAMRDTAPADVKRDVEIAGRRWTLRFRPHDQPELSFRTYAVPVVLVGGSVLSLLLFMLTYSEGRARMRAEHAATQLRASQEALEKANASLRESEARLRTFIDADIVGMLIADVSGRIYEANDAFLRLLGYPRDELQTAAMDWRKLTAPEFLPDVDTAMEQLQRAGRVGPYEKEFVRKDGAKVPVLVGKALLAGTGGRFVAFVLDLTERKRAEVALRKSEDQLRLVTDALPALVAYIDTSETFLFANQQFDEWLGLPVSRVVGRLVREVIGDEAYQHRRPYLDAALAGNSVRFHGPLPHRDGSTREAQLTYVPDRAPDGTVRGVVVLAADVTLQRRNEQALRRYADLFQHAELGLVMTGPDGVRLEMANPAFAKMCGFAADEDLAGRSLLEAFAPEYRTEVPSHVRIAQERGHHTFESVCNAPGGQRLPVEVDVTAVKRSPAAGAPEATVYHILSFSDIAERERAAQERERLLAAEQAAREEAESLAREAEEANRSKDEFLATLSHELRTPLNAMLGWSQLLRMGNLPDDEFAQGLETIERNARVQAQLVEDLLDLSRIISGKLRLEVGPVDLPATIEAALDSVRPAAEAKGIRLIPVIDTHAGSIRGDANRLQQVVWNLLSNAIKFTPKDGEVQVVLAGADDHAEVSVSDTGEGIPPEFLPHVFDRLRQADASITRKHGGLGLGLSIVRHLVELHGGTVAAQSQGVGRGATFTVRLPVAGRGREEAVTVARSDERVDEPVAPAAMPALAGVHVLVVDDEPDARDLIEHILRQCGAGVTLASSADEAMAAFETRRPDVLLSDIGMPGEDGYSLIRRVRALADEQGGNTPAVALTAFARVEDRDRALREGFQLHVSKPVEPAALANAVAELARRDANSPADADASNASEATTGQP